MKFRAAALAICLTLFAAGSCLAGDVENPGKDDPPPPPPAGQSATSTVQTALVQLVLLIVRR